MGKTRYILGSFGSGKTYTAQQEIIKIKSDDKKEVIVLDPFGEYRHLCNNNVNRIIFSEYKELVNMQEELMTLCKLLISSENVNSSITMQYISSKITHILNDIISKEKKSNIIILDFSQFGSIIPISHLCLLWCLRNFLQKRVLKNEQRGLKTHIYIDESNQFYKNPNVINFYVCLSHEMNQYDCDLTFISANTKMIINNIKQNHNDDYHYVLLPQTENK